MNWNRRVLLYLFLGGLAGCSQNSEQSPSREGKLRVTTTIAQIGDTVQNIGGDRVEVITLCGPGVDPHLYKASQGDIERLNKADIIFYNGLMLEGRMADIFVKIARSGKPTVAMGDGVDQNLLTEPPEFQGHFDPHIWMDASLWAQTINLVVGELSKLDPAGAEIFKQNGESYRKQLLDLHEYCKKQVATIPEPQRILLTAHDAFGYFGRAYGVQVMGLQGISTTSEPGLQDIQRLVDMILNKKVKAIFVESSISTRSIEAVVEGCKARGFEIKIGGELFSDAMGQPGTPEGTYVGMLKHNVDTIVTALK